MKLSTGDILVKIGPKAKLQRITMVTLTRLLAIRMVASSLSGCLSNSMMRLPFGVSSISSRFCSVREKYAISLPDTKPDRIRAKKANMRAMICPSPKVCGRAVVTRGTKPAIGKGSKSKSDRFWLIISRLKSVRERNYPANIVNFDV